MLSSSDTIAIIQSYAKPLHWYLLILSFSDQWVNSPYNLLAMLNAGVFGLLLPIYMVGLHGAHLDQLRPGEGRDLAIFYYTLPWQQSVDWRQIIDIFFIYSFSQTDIFICNILTPNAKGVYIF